MPLNVSKIKPAEGNSTIITEAELQRLKADLKKKEKELQKFRDNQLTTERLLRQLGRGFEGLRSVKVDPYPVRPHKVTGEEDQILLFSDAHAGEKIVKEEIDGFNEYNFEIMCQRLWHMMERTIAIKDLHSHHSKIKRLWVLSLGDIVTGEIHNMAETNEFPILATIQQTALVISQMLLMFASRYEEVRYVGVAGNHDRRHEKPRTKESDDNWSMMLNFIVSLLCKEQKNIHFHVPASPFTIVNIRGWNWLVRHGHGKTNSFAGIPFYGLSKKHSAYQELYRKRGGFDFEVLGHYHQSVTLKDDRVFINGSVIGANEFAINELAAYSPPSQKLLGVNEERGVTYTYRLTLEEAKGHKFIYDPDNVFEHKRMMGDFINTHFDSKRRR